MKDFDGWAVKGPDGNIVAYSFDVKKLTSIDIMRWNRYQKSWEQLYKKGYRCVKVKLEEVG